MNKVRIQFSTHSGHTFYLYNTSKGWNITSQNGISEAFSNFSKDPMLLKFALEDAVTDKQALAALKKYGRYVVDPYILGEL